MSGQYVTVDAAPPIARASADEALVIAAPSVVTPVSTDNSCHDFTASRKFFPVSGTENAILNIPPPANGVMNITVDEFIWTQAST
jgi:hypothetical protein